MVQSAPVAPPTDDPLQYFYSSDSDDAGVLQVRVCDKGSKAHCVKVSVQGVPMYGVVDSGADITIIGGEMFKQVAAAAKLRKKILSLLIVPHTTMINNPFVLMVVWT